MTVFRCFRVTTGGRCAYIYRREVMEHAGTRRTLTKLPRNTWFRSRERIPTADKCQSMRHSYLNAFVDWFLTPRLRGKDYGVYWTRSLIMALYYRNIVSSYYTWWRTRTRNLSIGIKSIVVHLLLSFVQMTKLRQVSLRHEQWVFGINNCTNSIPRPN